MTWVETEAVRLPEPDAHLGACGGCSRDPDAVEALGELLDMMGASLAVCDGCGRRWRNRDDEALAGQGRPSGGEAHP